MSSAEMPPKMITDKVKTLGATWGVMGDQDALQAAFENDEPVTLAGKLDGEVVYLGYSHEVWGKIERVGLDRVRGEGTNFPGHIIAVYLLDETRLDGAPKLADVVQKSRGASLMRAAELEERLQAEEDCLEHDSEDGA